MRYKPIKFIDLPREVKDLLVARMFDAFCPILNGFETYSFAYFQKAYPSWYTINYLREAHTDQWYVGDSRE